MDTVDRIDEILRERGISRRRMAQMIRVPSSTFARLFSQPHPEHVPYKIGLKIAQVLQIDPNEIYGNSIPGVALARANEPLVFLTTEEQQDPEKLLQQIILAFERVPFEDQFQIWKFAMQKVFDNFLM